MCTVATARDVAIVGAPRPLIARRRRVVATARAGPLAMRAVSSWRTFLVCRPAPCRVRKMSVHTWGAPRNDDVEAQRAAARGLLGVPVNATPKQLQEAYTKEALRWHPDRHIASAAVEETAAASLRFQRASDALAVLMQAEAERTGTKTWVYNKAENCWEWGLADDERQRMHPPGISSCTYDGSQGFSPSRSYRPPWASAESDDADSRTQKMHDGAWWDASWDAGAHDPASTSSSGCSSSEQSKRLWYLMLPVIAFLLLKNAVAVAFISAGPSFLLAPDETIERARAAAAASRSPG